MLYVGLDVHKETIAVAVAEDGKRAEVREHGEIANTPAALTKLLGKLGGPGMELHACYEARPCGYGIQRQVAAAGHDCTVGCALADSSSSRPTNFTDWFPAQRSAPADYETDLASLRRTCGQGLPFRGFCLFQASCGNRRGLHRAGCAPICHGKGGNAANGHPAAERTKPHRAAITAGSAARPCRAD